MSDSRRPAALALGLGAVLALAAQVAIPVAVPLYDGVTILEPYRYLSPASGQAGDPTSYSTEKPVANGAGPAFVAATRENPPQAQLIALPGAFVAAGSATTLKVSIEAVPPPPAQPTSGSIAGNVYRFAVTDESGAALTVTPAAGNRPTLTLRGPDGVTEGSIARLTPTGWQVLDTQHGGALAILSTNPTELGDFAVIVGGSGAGLNLPLLVAAILAIAVPIAVVGFLIVRRQRSGRAERLIAEAARNRNRIPSRRPGPRPPKGGRAGS
jgi:hypothetical protein